jgi:hypothetical protein
MVRICEMVVPAGTLKVVLVVGSVVTASPT